MVHILNKKASVSADIVVGHVTRSQNESDLSKYLMVHEQLCSIRDLYPQGLGAFEIFFTV